MNRKDFKLLETEIYLDHSSGALKPKSVIQAGVDFYSNYPINPHSIDSKLGSIVHQKIKNVRKMVAKLNNVDEKEVIFTSGTTDGLNQIANMMETQLNKGDEIVLNYLNHASNVIPWLEVAKKTGAKIIWTDNPLKAINANTKIVSVSEMNNTIGGESNIAEIYKLTQKQKAFLINDAAQSISHKMVDGSTADFTVWSANKLYGPTGTGVMIINKKIQDKMNVVRYGGGAIAEYNLKDWTRKDGYHALEPGTPNTSGIIMLGAAIEYINNIGFEKIWNHERELSKYAFKRLSELENIIWASKPGEANLVFNIEGSNSQDVVSYLGHKGVMARAGQHCVKIIKQITGQNSWIRVSLGLYNEKSDIDKLVELLKQGGDFLDFI